MPANFNFHLSPKAVGLHWLAVFLMLADRWLKVWALAAQPPKNATDFLTYSLNPRLAFSWYLPAGVIIFLTGLIIIVLSFYYWRLLKTGAWRSGLVIMIVLGAISNLADRLWYGGVIDYLNLGTLSVFNLADVLITVGLGWWLILEIFNINQTTAVTTGRKL